tara:strand:- start:558 stop:1097 length:540 start_codon:yes stop_codon:yes gene_type:complete
MSKQKKQQTPKKVWQPLGKSPDWFVLEQTERVFQYVKQRHPEISREAFEADVADETWGNDRYTIGVHLLGADRDGFIELAIHNHKRTPHVPWRHLQQIKNEILGSEREAVQIFPAESRLVDTANEFWLYVYPTGKAPMRKRGRGDLVGVKLGMDHGRNVVYETPEGFGRIRQSPAMEVA